MAMLAAPRRKQKFSIDPRGSSWSKDETKFGQKMLEKMGWSKGRGLGANEDGRTEHVKISLKDDTRGVGCSKSQADSWIAHLDDFNSLLANLNQNSISMESEDVVNEAKVLSLEETSKSSKGRLHYQKFTKGKDLSSRKLEDLDCIFGRRKKKKVSKEKTSPVVEENPISPLESVDSPSQQYGVQTFQSKDSIQGYFSRKMAQLDSCKRTNVEVNEAGHGDNEMKTKALEQENENELLGLKTFSSLQSIQDYFTQKMAKLKNDRMCSEMNGLDISSDAGELVTEEADRAKKKVKKHKKQKHESCSEELGEPVTKKKKKKTKITINSEDTIIESSYEISANESEVEVKKKRKKDKKKDKKKNKREIDSKIPVHAVDKENENEVSKENFHHMPQRSPAPVIGDTDTPSRKRVTFRDPIEAVLGETTPEGSFEISASEMTKAEHNNVTVETLETILGVKPPQDQVNIIEHSEFSENSIKKKTNKKAKKKAKQRELGEEIVTSVEGDSSSIHSDENFTVSAIKDLCVNNTKSDDTEVTNAAKVKKKNKKKRRKRTPKEIEMQVKKRKHILGCGEIKRLKTGFEGSNLDQIPGYSNCQLLQTAS